MFNFWKIGDKVRIKEDNFFLPKGSKGRTGVIVKSFDLMAQSRVRFDDTQTETCVPIQFLEFPYKTK